MSTVFVNVLVVVLFAVCAIGGILLTFAVAAKILHEIAEAFERSMLAGIGVVALCAIGLCAVVFGVRFGLPYVVDFYHQVIG